MLGANASPHRLLSAISRASSMLTSVIAFCEMCLQRFAFCCCCQVDEPDLWRNFVRSLATAAFVFSTRLDSLQFRREILLMTKQNKLIFFDPQQLNTSIQFSSPARHESRSVWEQTLASQVREETQRDGTGKQRGEVALTRAKLAPSHGLLLLIIISSGIGGRVGCERVAVAGARKHKHKRILHNERPATGNKVALTLAQAAVSCGCSLAACTHDSHEQPTALPKLSRQRPACE